MKIDGDRILQVIVHEEPEGQLSLLLEQGAERARKATLDAGIDLPEGACVYLWGHNENNARFVVVARMER